MSYFLLQNHQVIPNQKSDAEDLTSGANASATSDSLNVMTMADGYADHYCHELDNVGFGGFDEYFFSAGKGEEAPSMNKLFAKRDHRMAKADHMANQVRRIATTIIAGYKTF